MGDLIGAVEIARDVAANGLVIVVAGRNESVYSALTSRFSADPRVRVLSFTDQMPALLGATDALIHTTGGTTALEARAVGCPLINYGTGVAHVRAHARALADLGVAEWAPDRSSLGPALHRALAAGRRPALEVGALPCAADVIVEVTSR
jgi:UDP-N-acetylglucosamine:LPS N-acetylglucosamine transferase